MLAHRRWIRREGGAEAVANALAGGEMAAALLADQDRAMLAYVEKLTRRAGAMVEADVQALRAAGFDDPAIGDIATTAATYAFMNRIVDGLGCSLQRGWQEEAKRLGVWHKPADELAQ